MHRKTLDLDSFPFPPPLFFFLPSPHWSHAPISSTSWAAAPASLPARGQCPAGRRGVGHPARLPTANSPVVLGPLAPASRCHGGQGQQCHPGWRKRRGHGAATKLPAFFLNYFLYLWQDEVVKRLRLIETRGGRTSQCMGPSQGQSSGLPAARESKKRQRHRGTKPAVGSLQLSLFPKGDFYHVPPFFPPWSHIRTDGQSGAYRKGAHGGWVGQSHPGALSAGSQGRCRCQGTAAYCLAKIK